MEVFAAHPDQKHLFWELWLEKTSYLAIVDLFVTPVNSEITHRAETQLTPCQIASGQPA